MRGLRKVCVWTYCGGGDPVARLGGRRAPGAVRCAFRRTRGAGCTGHRPNSFQAEVATSRPKKIQKKARILVDLLNHSDTVSHVSTQTGYSPGSTTRTRTCAAGAPVFLRETLIAMASLRCLDHQFWLADVSVNPANLHCAIEKPFFRFYLAGGPQKTNQPVAPSIQRHTDQSQTPRDANRQR